MQDNALHQEEGSGSLLFLCSAKWKRDCPFETASFIDLQTLLSFRYALRLCNRR